MATAVRWSNTDGIAQCNMSRATPEVTGCCHWVTTCSISEPAAARATGKQTTINKYTYKAGHFDGRGGAPVQYRAYRPMKEVQGFTRSHWMPPSGSNAANSIKGTWLRLIFLMFFIVKMLKKVAGRC
jgi:hypothetical protein